jgi:hypothetical protein
LTKRGAHGSLFGSRLLSPQVYGVWFVTGAVLDSNKLQFMPLLALIKTKLKICGLIMLSKIGFANPLAKVG